MNGEKQLTIKLEKLNTIGIALSKEKNIDKLVERILVDAKNLVNADAGTLYLIKDGMIHFEIVRTKSLGIAMGGTTGIKPPMEPIELKSIVEGQNLHTVVSYCANQGETINIHDAYKAEGFDFSGTKHFDQLNHYLSKSFLTVPLKNHENEIIGVLQLINALDDKKNIIDFSPDDQRLVESLSSQAAIALTNRQLINQLEVLFESLIKLINTAIDDKSPYTGGHCKRVPELTLMIANAACETTTGPLKDFKMSEQDIYELKIAGLLHDCGKITTPVHVVDKSAKLETIIDRISIIENRFEILKRDAEIAYLMKRIDESKYRTLLEMYADDLLFIKRVNIGTDSMRQEDVDRIFKISNYKYCNSLGESVNFLTENEVENLSIRRGTLTEKERKIINHHIEVTIRLLEELPWPKHLKNVTEYAGGHHERMDGKGYPRGLTRKELSIPARMMGIADIFEALTAQDRPYKPAKTLSDAVYMLSRFAKDNHIDSELFEVFIKERVYLKYAETYLPKDQLDFVDEKKALMLAGLTATN